MSNRWYKVRRTYRVEDVVFVEAPNAAEAKRKVADGDYDDVTEARAISQTRHGRAQLVPFEDLPSDVRFHAIHGIYPS